MTSRHKVSPDDKLRRSSNKQNVVHLRFIAGAIRSVSVQLGAET